jgi:hypothetical protein
MIVVILGAALVLALGLMIVMPSTAVIGGLATVFGLLITWGGLWVLINDDEPI